ncbi:MAG TPA: PKD domain-containing protein [Bacteroidetes bacterium]|nr:PKD domain-containing protein [Bacteroidota bacterium]
MRYIVITCCFLFLACVLQAQVRWAKTFAGPNDDACQVRQTPDGGFILLGSAGFSNYLVRTDSLGDTLWSRKPNWADFCGLINTADGGFLLTGTTVSSIRDFVSYKLDANGDSVWAHVYLDTLDQGHYTALEMDDGGFILTGYTATIGNAYDMYVLRTDPLGDLQWRRTYGTANFDLGAMPALNRDNGFMFATTTNAGGPSEFLAVVTDDAGVVLWTRTYAAPDAIGGAVPTALADGGYLICGWIAGNGYDSYLIRTDSVGNPLWARSYGGAGFETRTSRGAIEDLNGGFTFVTSTDLSYGPGTDRDMMLVRVDDAGNLTRQVRVGGLAEDMPRYFEQTRDGSYILLGYTLSHVPNWKEIYLVRIDSVGCGERFFDLGIAQWDTICGGDTLWLDAGSGFSSYLWSNGAVSQRLAVTVADTYYVAAVDSNGCLYYSSLVFVEAKPGPSFNLVNQGNFLVNFYGAPGNALSWSWDFGDGQIDSLKNPVHVFPGAGTYVVCLRTEIAGCGTQSVCDTLVLAGLGLPATRTDLGSVRFDARANRLLVQANDLEGRTKFVLLDAAGRRVKEYLLEANTELWVNTQGYAGGVYFYWLEGRDHTWQVGKVFIVN